MNAEWTVTILANISLLGVLIYIRAWRRFPLFMVAQTMCVAGSGLLIWGYYSPLVDVQSFHSAYIDVDVMCILFDTAIGYELLAKYAWKCSFCVTGWMMLVHAILTLMQYAPIYSDSYYIHDPWGLRIYFNIFLTFAISFVLYYEAMSDPIIQKPHPKPADTGTGGPSNKPPPTSPPPGPK